MTSLSAQMFEPGALHPELRRRINGEKGRGPLSIVFGVTRDNISSMPSKEISDWVGDSFHELPGAGRRLIQKYSDRVLFLVTDRCFGKCPYCFREERLKAGQEGTVKEATEKLKEMIRGNDTINEVIFSGGDPLTLNNGELESLFAFLRDGNDKVHLRIHSRASVWHPSRFDASLRDVLSAFHVRLFHHIVHPKELTSALLQAVGSMNPVPQFNHFPLLAGVNDEADTAAELIVRLRDVGVVCKSVYFPEPVPGSARYRLHWSRIRLFCDELRSRLPELTRDLRMCLDSRYGKMSVDDITEIKPGSHARFETEGKTLTVPDLPLKD